MANGDSLLYGQPSDEYELFMPFAETCLKSQHEGGFKLHVTVATEHADPLARVILPTLRLLHTHHKVVLPGEFYARLNGGDQRGKFITIYAGPAMPAQRVVDTIDPVLLRLRAEGLRPGPVPTTRQSHHTEGELRIGRSGMIRTYWADNYRTS
ncbi:MAG: hypothetical protein KIT36_15655 [Alphaproteobacteria bacterium]|nr:hypothetical protein [Alphaproteobacteria bacterium]